MQLSPPEGAPAPLHVESGRQRAVPSAAASELQPLPNVEQGPLSPGAQLLQPGVNASRKMPEFSTNVAGQEGGLTHTDI